MADENLPITGVCIVDQTCPEGYTRLDKCEDNHRTEADLWKDPIFSLSKKVKRFLCFTKAFNLTGSSLDNVLVDLHIREEKDPPPIGYSDISLTNDSNEQALKKKLLSFQMMERSEATEAITDIQLLCKQKSSTPGYTLVGELNGLLLCYQKKAVTNLPGPPPIPPRPQHVQMQQYAPYGVNPVQVVPSQAQGDTVYGNAPNFANPLRRQDSHHRTHPLSGVPFEINPKLRSTATNEVNLGGFNFRSRENILHEFDYPFFVEKQAIQTSAHNGW